MFLNRLNEVEKTAFLELAHYIARSNHNFSKQEKDIIEKYCMEMQMDNIDFDKSNFDLSTTLAKIDNKTSQKIVLLEIMALIYADNVIDEAEEMIIDQMIDSFRVNEAYKVIFASWSKSILNLYIQGEAFLSLD